jgi:hypothetical protein
MTIGAMRLPHLKGRHPRLSSAGMEIAGAMSIASQMALMCPPGFDEWVRRELVGDAAAARLAARESERRRSARRR